MKRFKTGASVSVQALNSFMYYLKRVVVLGRKVLASKIFIERLMGAPLLVRIIRRKSFLCEKIETENYDPLEAPVYYVKVCVLFSPNYSS